MLERVRVEKAAVDAGFDITPMGEGGWQGGGDLPSVDTERGLRPSKALFPLIGDRSSEGARMFEFGQNSSRDIGGGDCGENQGTVLAGSAQPGENVSLAMPDGRGRQCSEAVVGEEHFLREPC